MKTVGRALVVGRLGVTSRDEAEVFRDDIRLLNVPTARGGRKRGRAVISLPIRPVQLVSGFQLGGTALQAHRTPPDVSGLHEARTSL